MLDPETGELKELQELTNELMIDHQEKCDRFNIKKAQIFHIGEIVELKGANYRVKAIFNRSIELTPCYP